MGWNLSPQLEEGNSTTWDNLDIRFQFSSCISGLYQVCSVHIQYQHRSSFPNHFLRNDSNNKALIESNVLVQVSNFDLVD